MLVTIKAGIIQPDRRSKSEGDCKVISAGNKHQSRSRRTFASRRRLATGGRALGGFRHAGRWVEIFELEIFELEIVALQIFVLEAVCMFCLARSSMDSPVSPAEQQHVQWRRRRIASLPATPFHRSPAFGRCGRLLHEVNRRCSHSESPGIDHRPSARHGPFSTRQARACAPPCEACR